MPALEVRCCCNPAKLLGFLEIEDEKIRAGETLSYYVPDDVSPSAWMARIDFEVRPALTREVVLEIRTLNPVDPNDPPYLAVRDNGYSIEDLRLVRDFTEAKGQP